MGRQTFVAACAFMLLAVTHDSRATLINYSETVSGDLEFTDSFLLDMAGLHQWTGSRTFSFFQPTGGAPVIDQDDDSFGITLGSGLEIAGASLIVANASVTAFDTVGEQIIVSDGTQFLYVENVSVFNTINDTPIDLLPSSAAVSISHGGLGFGCGDDVQCTASWDYTLSLTVREVPEPATAVLLLVMLAAAPRLRRCRATAAGSRHRR